MTLEQYAVFVTAWAIVASIGWIVERLLTHRKSQPDSIVHVVNDAKP